MWYWYSDKFVILHLALPLQPLDQPIQHEDSRHILMYYGAHSEKYSQVARHNFSQVAALAT